MLTEKEKEGFREILQSLCEDDLLALKDTVTNRLIAAQNKQEAIQAVLTHTDSAVQLLKRKKLKRDCIFTYLARHRVQVSPNAEKSKLIRTALNYWGTDVNQEADRQLLALAEVDDDEDGIPDLQVAPQQAPQPVQQPQLVPQPAQQLQVVPQLAEQPQLVPQLAPQRVLQPPPVHAAQPQGALVDKNYPNNIGVATEPLPFAQQLAQQFVTWFFQQLNALNQQMAQNGDASDWGPQHFFNDCKLKVNLQSHDSRREEFEGADVVSERFRSLVQTEGLLFNPNVSDDGTKGVNDPHGLVLVFVCGTIHREGLCLGVFEQRFGLVRDPLKDNNWKIKFTEVNVKSESVNQVPRLDGVSNFPALTGVL